MEPILSALWSAWHGNHPYIVKEGMFMHECSHMCMYKCLDTTEADWINMNHISKSHYYFRLPAAYLKIEGETLKNLICIFILVCVSKLTLYWKESPLQMVIPATSACFTLWQQHTVQRTKQRTQHGETPGGKQATAMVYVKEELYTLCDLFCCYYFPLT